MDDLSTRTCESELSNKPTVSLQHDRSTQEEQRAAAIPGNGTTWRRREDEDDGLARFLGHPLASLARVGDAAES